MDKQNKDNNLKEIYSQERLSLLNIRDLRDMGRKFGVPSPTTKNKKELIDYILKIIYGEVEASARSIYGRPSVREFNINKYVEKIKKNSVIKPESLRLILEDNAFETKVSSPSEDYDIDIIEQRVFVEIDTRYFLKMQAFIDSEDDIELSKELVRKFKLENFDVVEIAFNKDSFKIISVNGVKINSKLDGFEIQGSEAKGGTSHIFHYSTKEEIKDEILKIEKYCEEKNLKLFVFSNNNYTGKSTQTTLFNLTDSNSVVYKKLMCFVAHCEKQSIEADEFVMVIDRGDFVDEKIEQFEVDVSERIKKHLHETISKIVAFGNVLIVYKLDNVVIY